MGLYTILTKGDKLWSDKTKETVFGLIYVVNYGKVNIWEKLMEDKSYFGKIFPCISGYSDKGCSFGTGEGKRNAFTKGKFFPAFRQMGVGKELYLCLLFLNYF